MRSHSSAESKPGHLIGINPDEVDWKTKPETFWKEVFTEEQFRVCRAQGTEIPFSGAYCQTRAQGKYHCIGCGLLLFDSSKKFDSGTGWPSFSEAASEDALEYIVDTSHGMERTEVRCNRCRAHLGHVFPDGPPPTHQRFCINSVCLFKEAPNF